MTDTASLADAARRRFAELDTHALRDMWATEGRTEWAETALRDELIERGVRAEELDAVAIRRVEVADDKPPSSRDTIWVYGVVGRMVTLVTAGLVATMLRAVGEPKLIAFGIVLVVGTYVAILLRRISMQRKHRPGAAASFAMYWQAGEACLVLLGVMLIAL